MRRSPRPARSRASRVVARSPHPLAPCERAMSIAARRLASTDRSLRPCACKSNCARS